jgi:hypothetical protein
VKTRSFLKINLGDLQIENRLAVRLVFCFNDLARFILAAGVQAGPLAGVIVYAAETSATNATTNQTVICFHDVFTQPRG